MPRDDPPISLGGYVNETTLFLCIKLRAMSIFFFLNGTLHQTVKRICIRRSMAVLLNVQQGMICPKWLPVFMQRINIS